MSTNSGHVYRACVQPDGAGLSVLDFYVARFLHIGREGWEAMLAQGRVIRNGSVAQGAETLRSGDVLEYVRPPWCEPEVDLRFNVVFEDEHVLAVDKPAGLQVLPAGMFFEHTLLWQVRRSAKSRAESSPLHRLGRGTSGLILFGKTSVARAKLARQLREFEFGKTYLGWVQGTRLPDGCIARHRMERVAHGPLWIHVASQQGKSAVTRVRVLRRDPACERSLVAAQPITGRPDQIRVHLAALGAPLVGDPLFGPGGVAISSAPPGAGGYRLHAAALSFRHPLTRAWIKLRCLPDWI